MKNLKVTKPAGILELFNKNESKMETSEKQPTSNSTERLLVIFLEFSLTFLGKFWQVTGVVPRTDECVEGWT